MSHSSSNKPPGNRRLAIRLNQMVYRFSRRWTAYFNVVIGVYVALPILAPVLMQIGVPGPARAIYTIYSPLCHQMASRSFFLFGEQLAYPSVNAGTDLLPLETFAPDLAEFEEVADENWAEFFLAARAFVGNDEMGYKMALCARDISIYGFLFIGGVIYAVLRRRFNIRPLPLWAFVLIGMGPIGLDGFTQLFGYYATPIDGSQATGIQAAIQTVFPLRESTPFLRSFTGAVFGLMLAWLIYPSINNSMKETEEQVAAKLRRIDALPK